MVMCIDQALSGLNYTASVKCAVTGVSGNASMLGCEWVKMRPRGSDTSESDARSSTRCESLALVT